MTPIVVDTDVVSFLFKNDSRAQLYLPLLRNHELLVSFTTEAELEQWILLAKWGADRIQRFRAFITGFVALRCLPGHPQSEGLPWRSQSKPSELCLEGIIPRADGSGLRTGCVRQREKECRALSNCRFDPDPSAVPLDNSLAGRQSQAGSRLVASV